LKVLTLALIIQKIKIKLKNTLALFWVLSSIVLVFILLVLGAPIATQILDFNNFLEAIKDLTVWSSIFLSLYAAFISTLIAFILGVPLAYLLAREEFFGKSIIEGIIDLPMVIPHTVAGIAILTVFGAHGLIGQFSPIKFRDAIPGIIVAMLFLSVPFLVNSAKEGFKSIDPRLEYVARSLGASKLEVFFKVTFPLAFRSIMAGAIMSWARAISEFGAIVIIAYYPMVASVLIYDRFLSKGLLASRPVAILLLLICLLIFIALKLLVRKK
jgi:molybdate/tungstate transport system permease protein